MQIPTTNGPLFRWRWLAGPIPIDLDVNVHGPTAVITTVLAVLAIGAAWLLRDVLLAAPETAFPLLFTIFVGGAFVIAVVKKRWG